MKTIEQAEAAQLAAARELTAAAEAAAKYVVEVDPREAVVFRAHLRNLADRLSQQPSAEQLQSARDGFQSELREYATRAGGDVRRMKQELGAAAAAMQSFAQGISTSSHDHEKLLHREFQQLTRAAGSGDVPTMRAAIHETVATVTAGYQELRQAHNLVVAQLRDEIRILQQSAERPGRAAAKANLLDKRGMDQRIEESLRSRQPFHLLLAKLCFPAGPNIPGAVREHARAEFIKTLQSLAGASALADWSPACFAAILAPATRDLIAWEQQLAACHVYQQEGIPRPLRISPRLLTVEFAVSDSPSLFFSRLSQAVENFEL